MHQTTSHPSPLHNEPEPKSTNPTVLKLSDPCVPDNAHIVTIIRRHIFGLVMLYLQFGFGIILSLGLIIYLLPTAVDADQLDSVRYITNIVSILMVTAVSLFLLIITALYRQNRWVITDETITQVTRYGIFRSQTSALAMDNIEDVTSIKHGLIASFFNFGSLRVQTASEQLNTFIFPYCPDPDKFAKILLDTREAYIAGRINQDNA